MMFNNYNKVFSKFYKEIIFFHSAIHFIYSCLIKNWSR
jgi:hypothetical protein